MKHLFTIPFVTLMVLAACSTEEAPQTEGVTPQPELEESAPSEVVQQQQPERWLDAMTFAGINWGTSRDDVRVQQRSKDFRWLNPNDLSNDLSDEERELRFFDYYMANIADRESRVEFGYTEKDELHFVRVRQETGTKIGAKLRFQNLLDALTERHGEPSRPVDLRGRGFAVEDLVWWYASRSLHAPSLALTYWGYSIEFGYVTLEYRGPNEGEISAMIDKVQEDREAERIRREQERSSDLIPPNT